MCNRNDGDRFPKRISNMSDTQYLVELYRTQQLIGCYGAGQKLRQTADQETCEKLRLRIYLLTEKIKKERPGHM